MPLTATIAPAAQRARPRRATGVAARRPARPSRRRSAQPRPAGRAGVRLGVEAAVERVLVLGRGRRAHIAKPAIVVSGRSYGTPRTIVKRGPQLVQLMNG